MKCNWCEDEKAVIRVVKGTDKGTNLCDSCFDDWSDNLIQEMIEDLE
jgi:protein-arginine kinase activator protein McsA